MRVTRCTEKDIDIIYEIEKDAFKNPLKRETMLNDMRRDSHYCYVISHEEPIGFLSFDKVFDEGQIISVAIKSSKRQQGWGKRLFAEVKELAKRCGVSFFTLEVRSDNTAAIALYTALGFERVGLRRGYYENPVCDAILMNLDI